MIVLDTNIVSEVMRPVPNAQVLDWLDTQLAETLYITSITWAELTLGLERMPAGKRKNNLVESLKTIRSEIFGDRILPFDEAAVAHYGTLMAMTQKKGQILGIPDGQIAAIAFAQRLTVATRDIAPFVAAGLKVINPWANRLSD